MKKILLSALGAIFLLFSCSQDDMPEIGQPDLDQTISKLTENYEAHLKGYTIGDKEKDEKTPTTMKETSASDEFVSMIKDSLERTYSKTAVRNTKVGNDMMGWVGVLKYASCGSYRDFEYHQDNEDGGWTNTWNSGWTYADGNKNMVWKFCLVPGHARSTSPSFDYRSAAPYYYGGGVLLLYKYLWNSGHGDVDVVFRYHDDEDHSNKNSITNMGGQVWDPNGYLGECYFGSNTGLTWRFSDRAINYSLPFKYGVLTNDFSGSQGDINIDDENGSNADYAVIYRHKASSNTTERRDVRGRDERFRGVGIWNTNTQYMIKIYN